jgi:serine/threonine protein kinase
MKKELAPPDPDEIWPEFRRNLCYDSDIPYVKLGALYEVLEVKGAGGFGVVLAARHKGSGKKMALKLAPSTS